MNITTCQRASTEAEHSTNCIPDRSKVIFNDVVKELLGETPAKHFLGTKCKVSTFEDMKKALPSERIGCLTLWYRVLFWRLLAVSMSRVVDLWKVLDYELVAVLPASNLPCSELMGQ